MNVLNVPIKCTGRGEEKAETSADCTTCSGGGSRYNQLTVPRVEEEEADASADCTTCSGGGSRYNQLTVPRVVRKRYFI
jgi:hypothetical protein